VDEDHGRCGRITELGNMHQGVPDLDLAVTEFACRGREFIGHRKILPPLTSRAFSSNESGWRRAFFKCPPPGA
jgi:hypothetical protein